MSNISKVANEIANKLITMVANLVAADLSLKSAQDMHLALFTSLAIAIQKLLKTIPDSEKEREIYKKAINDILEK